MGILDDKVYEEMDFINKLVEPFDIECLKVLEDLPEKIEVEAEDLLRQDRYHIDHLGILKDRICRAHPEAPDWVKQYCVFTLDGIDVELFGTPKLDKANRVIVDGKMFIIVGKPKPDLACLRRIAQHIFAQEQNGKDMLPKEAREVLGLLGVKTRKRIQWWMLSDAFDRILINDAWKIRSDRVVYNIIRWMYDYTTNGTYSSYASLLNVKCMVHRGNPIYSAEDV